MTDYLTPPPNPDNPNVVAAYDEASLWSMRFAFMLLDNIELRRGMTVLDIACGTGVPLFPLAAALGPSSRLVGADIWRAAMHRARLKRDAYPARNVDLAFADAVALPFRDGAFDLIVSNVGVNNFEDQPAALRECLRVMRPRGRIALTTNLQGQMREFYDVFRALLEEIGTPEERERLDANERHRLTRASLTDLLTNAGFKLDRAVEDTFAMRYADAAAFFSHWLIRGGFLPSWRAVVGPERENDVFEQLARRIDAVAAPKGDFIVTVPALYVEAVLAA